MKTALRTIGIPDFSLSALLRLAVGILFAIATAGCSSQPSVPPPLTASLTYGPEQAVIPVNGAESIHVEVRVSDSRRNNGKLSNFVNKIYDALPSLTPDDLSSVVKSGVESELKSRGFELDPGNALLLVDLQQIEDTRTRNDRGEDSAHAVATMRAVVKGNDGTVIYSKEVSGQAAFPVSTEEGGLGAVSERALDSALDDAVRNLMADPDFIEALLSTR